jgi:hypothetical protein
MTEILHILLMKVKIRPLSEREPPHFCSISLVHNKLCAGGGLCPNEDALERRFVRLEPRGGVLFVARDVGFVDERLCNRVEPLE